MRLLGCNDTDKGRQVINTCTTKQAQGGRVVVTKSDGTIDASLLPESGQTLNQSTVIALSIALA